ncbi:hypothetical protein K469DRAFT_692413 [Zopfia rhizophila CBS 207.26]|uniref:WW domain-containing protein n=1 Tax=Zopfia rhizophila CBS 207.26 TaxID=1314779 RepID=A0A6A6DRM1_9PEZI|nr:hypothetical protein K469DRAFT_692413 [Zopfia rhizophila CBS 207.26]
MSLPPHWVSQFDKQNGRICYVHKLSGATQYDFPNPGDEARNRPQTSVQQPRQPTLDSITSSMSTMSVSESGQPRYQGSNTPSAADRPQQYALQQAQAPGYPTPPPSVRPILTTVALPLQPRSYQTFRTPQPSHPLQFSVLNSNYAPGGDIGGRMSGQVQPNIHHDVNTSYAPTQTHQYASNQPLPSPASMLSNVQQAPPSFMPEQHMTSFPTQQQAPPIQKPVTSSQLPQQNEYQRTPWSQSPIPCNEQPQPQVQSPVSPLPANPVPANSSINQNFSTPAVQAVQPSVSEQFQPSPMLSVSQPVPVGQMSQACPPSSLPSPMLRPSNPGQVQQPTPAQPSVAAPQNSAVAIAPISEPMQPAPPAVFPPHTNVQRANNAPQNPMQPPQYHPNFPQCPAAPYVVTQPQCLANKDYPNHINGQSPQPQAAQTASGQQGISSSAKDFFKNNKGKLAVGAGVGGALLAGLVGVEIGDGIGYMFGGGYESGFESFGEGGGCDGGDYGGGGECADAGGGNSVDGYADPTAGGYGYDQAMLADSNAVTMQEQMFMQQQQAMITMNDASLANLQNDAAMSAAANASSYV